MPAMAEGEHPNLAMGEQSAYNANGTRLDDKGCWGCGRMDGR
jgi:hypothetical protein